MINLKKEQVFCSFEMTLVVVKIFEVAIPLPLKDAHLPYLRVAVRLELPRHLPQLECYTFCRGRGSYFLLRASGERQRNGRGQQGSQQSAGGDIGTKAKEAKAKQEGK